MDQPEDTTTLPARFYRRKAAEARRSAEAVTTGAVKERLHNLAHDFDRMADAADSVVDAGREPISNGAVLIPMEFGMSILMLHRDR